MVDREKVMKALGLSAREAEVAALAALGKGDKAIAGEMGVSLSAVKLYLQHAYRKVLVANRTELARRVILAVGMPNGYDGGSRP